MATHNLPTDVEDMDWQSSSLFNSPALEPPDMLLTPCMETKCTPVNMEESSPAIDVEDELEKEYVELQPISTASHIEEFVRDYWELQPIPAVSRVENKLHLSITEEDEAGPTVELDTKPEVPGVHLSLTEILDNILSTEYLDILSEAPGADDQQHEPEAAGPDIVDWSHQPPLGLPLLEVPAQGNSSSDNSSIDWSDLTTFLMNSTNEDINFNATDYNDLLANFNEDLFHPEEECEAQNCRVHPNNFFRHDTKFVDFHDSILYLLNMATHKNLSDTHMPSNLKCIKCPNSTPQNAYDSLKHTKAIHGDILYKFRSITRIKETLKLLIMENEIVNLYCHICHVSLGSAYNFIIHMCCVHSSADCRTPICPFCLEPLLKESLFAHFKSKHRTVCCNEKITGLKQFFTHSFNNKHLKDTVSLISPESLNLYYRISSKNLPNIYWNPTVNIMLIVPRDKINTSVPTPYTKEFFQVVQELSNFKSLFYLSLNVSQYVVDLNDRLANRWGALKIEFANLRDAVLLEQWIDYSRAMWSGSNVIIYNSHDREVLPRSDRVLCESCQDGMDHGNTANFCIRASEIAPKFNKLNEAVNHMHSRKIHWSRIAAIWICNGKNPLGQKSPSSVRYPVLNLSYVQTETNFPCFVESGREKALNKTGQFTSVYFSLKNYIATVCSVLPKGCHVPIFIEFCANHTITDENEMVIQAAAFASMLVSLREKYSYSFIVLGPHPTGKIEIDREHYEKEKNRLLVFNNILSLVCAAANITVIQTLSTICIYEKFPNVGVEYESALESFIFNYDGSPTRNYVKKLTGVYEDFMDRYSNVITTSLYKKYFYQTRRSKERNFHFNFENVADVQ